MSINANHERYRDFAAQRSTLTGLISRSADVITELNMVQFRENLTQLQQKVENDGFKIMVVGTFKNGKSTFINSFLGEEILPAYSIPCTAVINEVKYGKEKKAILHFRDPLPEKLPDELPELSLEHMEKHGMAHVPPLEIPYDEIEDYVVIPMGEDPNEMLLESPYEKVELFWPLPLLQNGVEIIDSPGLNEHATRTRVTMEYLTKADAILMVLNAQALCSENEMEFVANDLKGQGFSEPFFVVNRFDCIPQREQEAVQRFAASKLKEYTSFGAEGIYYVSALDALDGKMENDAVLYENSGMNGLERELALFLIRGKGKAKLTQPAHEVRRLLQVEALQKAIPLQRQMLRADLDEVKARYAEIQPKLRDLTARKEQLKNKLMLKIGQSRFAFSRAIEQNMRELSAKVGQWVDAYEPVTKMGLIPNREKSEAAVREIAGYIALRMDEQQRSWRNTVLSPLIEEKAAEIFESAENDAAKILGDLGQIHVDITGNRHDADPVPTWQRIVGIAGGLALGDVGLAASGGINGLSKELAKTFALEFGAGFVLGMLGLWNPITLCATLVGAFLFNFKQGQSNAMKKLKESVRADAVGQLENTAEQTAAQLTDSIIGKFESIALQIVSALDAEINEVNHQMQGIIAEMEKGQAHIEQRELLLADCEEQIRTLNDGLNTLTLQLTKG